MVSDEQEALKWTSRPELKTFQILADDLATVSLNQTEILWDKPTIVGACILDLSKKFMYAFHYKTMKQNFDCKLLYSDTDSFVYEVQTEDFYADIDSKQLRQQFDFSNFPKNHPQNDGSNAKVTLKFKVEMAGRTVSEFVGLKSKLYWIKLSEGKYFFILTNFFFCMYYKEKTWEDLIDGSVFF